MNSLNISVSQLLSVTLDAVIITDQTGVILEFNPAAEVVFGYTRNEVLGQSMIDQLIPSRDRRIYQDKLKRYIEFGHPTLSRRYEAVALRRDGLEFPVELAINLIQLDDKVLFIAYIRDVSDRIQIAASIKANEENLERNRERVEAILNNSTDAILLLSEDFTIQQANPAFTHMFGYHPDDVFNQAVEKLVQPSDVEKLARAFGILVRDKTPQFAEFTAQRRDGTIFSADFGISLVRSKQSPELGIVCSIRDITEIKRVQNVLAEERNLLRTLIDSVPDYIYIKDTNHHFLLSNIAHAQARGFNVSDEIIGKSDRDFFPAELAAEFYAEEEGVLQSGIPLINHEQRSKALAGGFTWALSTKVPLKNLDGELVGLVGITRDISEQKALEDREHAHAKNLRAVVEATDELLTLKDTDTVFRRAVELAREQLHVERCAIFMLDESGQYLKGTFGTDEFGKTTDERMVTIPMSKNPELLMRYEDPWWVTQNGALSSWQDAHLKEIGKGWIATTIIRSGDEPIGFFSNDAAISGAPLDPVQQESLAIFCSLLGNVLQRKRTEENLQMATSRMGNLIENLDAGILLENEHREVAVINQTFCNLFAIPVPPETLIGTDCSRSAEVSKHLFLEPDRFVSGIDQLLAKQQKVIGEELALADGRTFLRDYVPIFLNGRYLGHLWQYHDATEVFKARARQQRLMDMEHLQRQIADLYLHTNDIQNVMPQVLSLIGQTVDVSRTYIAHFRTNERLMDTLYEWCAVGVAPELHNNQAVPFDDLFPSLFPTLMQYGIIAPSNIRELPDDMRTLLEVRGFQTLMLFPFYVAGRLDGVVGLAEYRSERKWMPEEITAVRTVAEGYARIVERKRSEESLVEARDSALKTARLKSEFMSNMSHEIRTPMTGVLGMLELLLETELDETQREFADDANMSAKRLLKIINDILDFSKIEAGQMVLAVEPIDLRGMVREVITTVSPLARPNAVELIEDIAPNLPARIVGDATRLSQILINLVGNAVKFTKKGNVTIRITVIGQTEWNVRLRFEVQDTGIGIPENQINRIFGSFVQADGTSTRKYGGTGLGLAISKQLVELMGGEIEVRSHVGEGSTFKFVLSLPYVSKRDIQSGLSTLSRLKVMVVDEDKTSRFMLSQQFRIWGIEVDEVDHPNKLENVIYEAILHDKQFALVLIHSSLSIGEAVATYLRSSVPKHIFSLLVRLDDRDQPFNPDESDFDTHLLRPVRQSDLYNLLISATDAPTSEDYGASIEPIDRFLGKVLLAEDNELNQSIVVRALKSASYKVDIAQNGQEALNLLEQNHYDVVLMDIHMPVMDGKTATKIIRSSQKSYNNIPIVAVTASALSEEQDEYIALGMNEVIAKPFSLADLRSVVAKWVSHRDAS